MSGNLFICAKSDGQNLRRPTLTEAFPDPAKSTFPDACLLRFRISRLARPDHGGVWLCTDWVRTDATTEVVLRLAGSDPPSSTLCRDGHCKWVSPNDDGGNSESKDELFHQIPPMSRNVLNLPACAVPVARSSVATPVRSSFFISGLDGCRSHRAPIRRGMHCNHLLASLRRWSWQLADILPGGQMNLPPRARHALQTVAADHAHQ